jgi:hypothetical protein
MLPVDNASSISQLSNPSHAFSAPTRPGTSGRLNREKAEIAESVRFPDQVAALEIALRQFCDEARAKFDASADFDGKRAFLVGHIERVIFSHYKVTLVGSVPLPGVDEAPSRKLPFRIVGEIDPHAHRFLPKPIFWALTKSGNG